jgi:hypothetical protein
MGTLQLYEAASSSQIGTKEAPLCFLCRGVFSVDILGSNHPQGSIRTGVMIILMLGANRRLSLPLRLRWHWRWGLHVPLKPLTTNFLNSSFVLAASAWVICGQPALSGVGSEKTLVILIG